MDVENTIWTAYLVTHQKVIREKILLPPACLVLKQYDENSNWTEKWFGNRSQSNHVTYSNSL